MRLRQSPLLLQVSICKQRILWFCLKGRKSVWYPRGQCRLQAAHGGVGATGAAFETGSFYPVQVVHEPRLPFRVPAETR